MLCGVLLLCGSCTKEDLSDCRTKVQLKLEYTLNSEGQDRFDQVAEFAEVFLYDGAGALVQSRPLTAAELESLVVELSVPQGEASYTVVVWANRADEDYQLSGSETLTSMRVDVRHENGQVGRPWPDWTPLGELMQGSCTFTGTVDRSTVEGTVSLRKVTNHIYVILDGAASGTLAANPTPYTIQLTGNNGSYGWNAGSLTCPLLSYAGDYSTLDSQYPGALVSVFHTLHITDDLRLAIFNGTSTLQDVSVKEQLQRLSLSEQDLWRYDSFTLRFDANMMLTAIKILEWHEVDNNGGV